MTTQERTEVEQRNKKAPHRFEPKKKDHTAAQPAGEVNGPRGLEPTRFGDWEKNGRCSDF